MPAIVEPILQSAARTASGNSNVFSSGDYDDAQVFLDITAVSGTTPTLDVTIQYSPDGTRWFTHTAFAQKTTTDKDSKQISGLGKSMRIAYTIGGTGPSFTFQMDIVAKNRGK